MPQSVPICHNCTKKYSKDPPLIPLLLKCGHSYCEGCISRFGRLIKYSGNITCPECAEYHYIASVKSIKQLQINAHIYGVICAPNRKTENAVDSIVHSDLTNKLADLARQQSSDDEVPEEESSNDYTPCCECKGKSDVNCNDCSLPYCAACSTRVHQLVALYKHSPVPIQPTPLFECRYHPGVVPTQFLVEEKKLVCPECPPPGETVDVLCEARHMEDLKQKLNLARETLEKTDTTITSDLIPTVEQDFLRLKSEVRKEFGYFHGLLQAREQTLLDELETKQMQTVQPLLDFRSEIVKSTKVASKNFNWIMRNKDEKNVLVKKQEHVQEIKKGTDAIKSTLFIKSEKRPTVTTKKEMLSQCITEFCKVNADGVHQYFMDAIECTAGRKYTDDVPLFTPPVENEWESAVLNNSKTSISSEPCEPLTVSLAVAENRDQVVVSMVYNPHYFYVQKTKDRDNLDDLQNILVKYYGLSFTPEDYLKSVGPGDLVCCQYTLDELWYRAHIIHVEDGVANVLYIDYGNSEVVPLTRLRRLKTQFTHCPALAIKCALYSITPRDGQSWTEEAVESLRRLTAECEFEMITKGKVHDFTEVDLLKCGSDIGSTREFLVFLEHACFSTTKAITNVDDGSEELDHGIQLESVQVEPRELPWPDADEYILVKVSHIESPSEFFVQLNSHVDILQKIGSDISLHMESDGKKFPLKELKKGVMCLALYPGDGNFYRAVILGAVDFNVQVFYCDYGNSDSVQCSDLYEMPASLAVETRLSITASLYGIGPVPNDQAVWSAPEIGFFEQLVVDKQVFATLKGAEHGRTKISLTDTTRSIQDVEIANEMIYRGYGVSTLPPPPPSVQCESSAPFGEISLGPVKTTRGATICHVTSPHLINVNLVDMPYPPFFQKLNAAYSRFVKTGNRIIERETTWNIGDLCVAYLSDMELFIRAKIVSFTIPQSAMVENIDQGRITKVSFNDLKVLIDDFSLVKTPKFAAVCRLFDVTPPTGTDWTLDQNKKVLKYFSRKVKKGNASCFVTVMGERDPESGTCPVNMMLFDPAANIRERVSDELVKLGLAKLIVNKVQAPKGDYEQKELTVLDGRGKVIHVSNNCTMYFTPDSMRPESERLADNLLHFKENPADVEWRVGAACVAKSDKWFYRGIVTNIIGTKILDLHLVDTGTVQQLHVQHVFPTFLCPDVPILAVPLHLAYIQPAWHSSDGSWSNSASSYLYETVVNEKCDVDFVSKEDKFYTVTMSLTSGVTVEDCMVSKGYAVSCEPQSMSPRPASPRTNSTVVVSPRSASSPSSASLSHTGSFSPATNTSGDATPRTPSIDGC